MNATALLLCVFCALLCVEGLLRCSQVMRRPQYEFQLIRSCSRSSALLLVSGRLPTFEACKRFAADQLGLALNFVDPKFLEDEDEDTCLVYDCPEMDPSTMEEESMYDYYGLYPDLDPESNMTCVPGVGMFKLHQEKANFSVAEGLCVEEEGKLARVISPRRTDSLSALVATLGSSSALHKVYVGMHDMEQEGYFVTIAGEPVSCFEFLAWAPGQPKNVTTKEDCVVLDSRQGWRVVDCSVKLPFLCEFTPPDPCGHIRNISLKQKCLTENTLEISNQKTTQRCFEHVNSDSSDEYQN